MVGHYWMELLLIVARVELRWMKVNARRGECPSVRLIVVVRVDSVFRDMFLKF